jgi:hypothetical protein
VRLKVLSAALAACWDFTKHTPGIHTCRPVFDQDTGHRALFELLVLLVQQLQAASPEARATFLHSPAGSEVLRVLNQVLADQPAASGRVAVMTDGRLLGAGGVQQLSDSKGSWRNIGHTVAWLVEVLVLPGLLLQPAPELWPPWVQFEQLAGNGGRTLLSRLASMGALLSLGKCEWCGSSWC